MQIFDNEFDVYGREYTYDEMKVMHMLGVVYDTKGFDYEDLMRIAEAVYYHWNNYDEIEERFYDPAFYFKVAGPIAIAEK